MRNKKGFTLTELLIVVSILVFLILVSIVSYRKQLIKGLDARRKADLNRIRTAVEEYEKDHDCYPPRGIIENCKPGEGLRPYLDKIPCDPITDDYYRFEIENSDCPSWYILYANLENLNDKTVQELNCLSGCGPENSYNYYVSSYNAPSPVSGEASTEPTQTPFPYEQDLYGCFSGVCQKILTFPACHPNYQSSNCYGSCTTKLGLPINECGQ